MNNYDNYYPRPLLKRDSFFSLNGSWKLNGYNIEIPFPPESDLSAYDGSLEKMDATFNAKDQTITVTDTTAEQTYVVGYDAMPFVDVVKGDYYYDAVDWADLTRVTAGTTPTTFSPDESATRAQTMTFLWKLAGCPEPTNADKFSDVNSGDYYYKAVAWAAEQGITSGTGDGSTFSPDETITRAQIVTFLYRLKGNGAKANNSFTDVAADDYYSNSVAWAAEQGITSGTGDGSTFSPEADCLRAQIMTFLYRVFGQD